MARLKPALCYECGLGDMRHLKSCSKAGKLGPKTTQADAERELDELRTTSGGLLVQSYVETRVRVRGFVRVLAGGEWAEVGLQIRLYDAGGWLNVIAEDHPLLVARLGQPHVEHVEAAIKRFLLSDGGITGKWDARWEERVGGGGTDYRSWLVLRARHGVAVRTRPDGMLNVYGL